MATQKTAQPGPPDQITDYTRNKLCAEWSALDAERLKLAEAAKSKERRQKEIETALAGQLERDGVNLVDLPRWQFGNEFVAGSFSYKNELEKEIGFEELERRKALIPKRPKFFLRDKGRPAPKARQTRRKAA